MKHPLTWWQRNGVQGRAEVLLFYVLTLLLVVLFVFWATRGWAEHLSRQVETLECSERNHYCGQTLGHDSQSSDPAYQEYICRQRMEAAMREHDALDQATLDLEREYASIPTWLFDIAPGPDRTCLALGGHYKCGDEANWPRELTKQSIEQKKKQIEEDEKLLAKRDAYRAEERSKRDALEQRRGTFKKQWDAVKHECWRQP